MKMKTLKRFLAVAVLALLAFPPRLFALVGIEAGVGGWQPEPLGSMGYKGTSLDLKNDLNYSRRGFVSARVRAELPLLLPNLYLAAQPMSYDGQSSRNLDFQFNGQTFSKNVPFNSKLKLDHYDLGFFYGIPFLKTATAGILNLDLGLNARLIDFKAEMTASNGAAESKSQAVAVPLLYAGLQVKPLDWLNFAVDGRGVGYGGNQYLDVAARIKLNFLQFFFASGGYKYQLIKIDQSDIRTNLNFGGPTAEIGAEF